MVDVAILGTGRMGAAMARRVAAAGHDLVVWNRTERSAQILLGSLAAGCARVARTAADAVAGRAVVLSMLADGAATREVILDSSVLDALAAGAVVCDLATSGVATAVALRERLAQAAIAYVDAPVSGSVPAVNAGTLLVMASGEPAAIATVEPVLRAFARKVLRVGDAGTGQAMKLAVNLVVHDLNAAISEALILAESAGIPRDSAYDVLQDSVVAAPFVAYKRAAFLDPATPVAMSLDLVLKDLRLITEFAAELAVATSVTESVRAAVAAACAAGLGPEDMAALSRFRRTDPVS